MRTVANRAGSICEVIHFVAVIAVRVYNYALLEVEVIFCGLLPAVGAAVVFGYRYEAAHIDIGIVVGAAVNDVALHKHAAAVAVVLFVVAVAEIERAVILYGHNGIGICAKHERGRRVAARVHVYARARHGVVVGYSAVIYYKFGEMTAVYVYAAAVAERIVAAARFHECKIVKFGLFGVLGIYHDVAIYLRSVVNIARNYLRSFAAHGEAVYRVVVAVARTVVYVYAAAIVRRKVVGKYARALRAVRAVC